MTNDLPLKDLHDAILYKLQTGDLVAIKAFGGFILSHPENVNLNQLKNLMSIKEVDEMLKYERMVNQYPNN